MIALMRKGGTLLTMAPFLHMARVGLHGTTRIYSSLMLTFNVLPSEYVITGRREALQEPELEYRVHLMDLASDDRHSMQLDPQYTPNPTVNEWLSCAFCLPPDMEIAYGSRFVTITCAIPYFAFAVLFRSSRTKSSSLFCIIEIVSPSILNISLR